jgi:ADP-ribose pyrophosphatase YjhB (NUDIX family)
MPLKPRYCAQCGEAVVTRPVDGRPRLICPACGTVFYENPLPVAAAVVLNEQREVLLVKRRREPYQGTWCLPMGFAERGETIAAAALRELKEETGVDARIVRLVDADSFESTHYGDLLIVTFEVRKVGGAERAGDDAQDIQYFPVDGHPPLAFSSNEKALRECAAAHADGWAIQDSFVRLQADEEEAMLSDELVELIQNRADEVAKLWLADVRSNPTTRSYQTIDPDRLLKRVTLAISQFGRWLKGDEPPNEVKAFYRILARERAAQGFEVHELLSSITLLKKHLWTFVRSQGIWDQPVDAYRVLEFSRRVGVFFDKATYYALRAFRVGSAA